MSCCPAGKTPQQITDLEKNNRINKEIRQEKRLREKEMKLLLLGTRDTTCLQVNIIYASMKVLEKAEKAPSLSR